MQEEAKKKTEGRTEVVSDDRIEINSCMMCQTTRGRVCTLRVQGVALAAALAAF